MDRVSRKEYEKPFRRLTSEEKDQVLRYVDKGALDDDSFNGEDFIHTMIDLSLEGFIGDPVHGGNRDGVGWKYIGYTPGCPKPREHH